MFLTFSRSTDDAILMIVPDRFLCYFPCMQSTAFIVWARSCATAWILYSYCTHGTAGVKQFKPSISIQIYLYVAFPHQTFYNLASKNAASQFKALSNEFEQCSKFWPLMASNGLGGHHRNTITIDRFSSSMKHAFNASWYLWKWMNLNTPYSEKWWGVELYRERTQWIIWPSNLSCVLLTLISWMHAWVRHTSSVMYFSTVAISITIQSGIPFESWAELSEVTEQLGVEEECEHYCNYI